MNCATHQLEVSQYGLYSHRCVFFLQYNVGLKHFWPQTRAVIQLGRPCIYWWRSLHLYDAQLPSDIQLTSLSQRYILGWSLCSWLYLLVTSGLAPFWKHTSEDLKLVRCWDEKGRLGISAFYLSEKFYQSEKCGANLGGLLLVDS